MVTAAKLTDTIRMQIHRPPSLTLPYRRFLSTHQDLTVLSVVH